MDHSFVWYPDPKDSPISTALGGIDGLYLPHLVPAPAPGTKGLSAHLDARTLACGILAVGDSRPPFHTGPVLSSDQLRRVLRFCATDLGFVSEDDAAANVTNSIRQLYGDALALQALRRSVVLIPDSVMARGNFVANLFLEGCREEEERTELFGECVDEFAVWRILDTSHCGNEAASWYCGLAALTWLDRRAERDTLILGLPPRVINAEGWGARFERLREARAGDVVAIRIH